MIVVAFVLVYLAGATAIAFWIDRRVPRLAPTDFVRAFVYLFAAAAANQVLDGPLAGLAARSLPAGPVIATMGVIFPMVVWVCLTAIWVLRLAQRTVSGLRP